MKNQLPPKAKPGLFEDPEALNDKFLGDLERITNPQIPKDVIYKVKAQVGPVDTPEEIKEMGLDKDLGNNGPKGP